MKTITKKGRQLYKDVLVEGHFRCRQCGCEFRADQEDIEFEILYTKCEMIEKIPFSSCPQCGERSEMIEGRYEKRLAAPGGCGE